MNESNKRKFDSNNGQLDTQKVIMIAVAGVVAVVILVVLIVNIFSKNKEKDPKNPITPTPTQSAIVTLPIVTDAPTTKAPTNAPTNTPTPIPTATATVTPTPTAAAVTNPPVVTEKPEITPQPELPENAISAQEAYGVLCKYKKEALSIAKDVKEYEVSYDSSTTLINGTDCYRFTLFETIDGKRRNRGDFFISVDGKCCYVQDTETGSFVPLPLG